MGIVGCVLSIFTQFLSNRSQHIMVLVGVNVVSLVIVMSCVPLGSVLGKLLFFLYTSEAFSILGNKLIGYADDSILIAVVPSITVTESLIRDLVKVSEWCHWCDLWGMKLNATKTNTMIVSRSGTMHPQLPSLSISSTELKEFDGLLRLGVKFDSKMTFEQHLRARFK